MTGKDAPPEVKIWSYRDSPICDVVVVVKLNFARRETSGRLGLKAKGK
jgi:hypothetical protein